MAERLKFHDYLLVIGITRRFEHRKDRAYKWNRRMALHGLILLDRLISRSFWPSSGRSRDPSDTRSSTPVLTKVARMSAYNHGPWVDVHAHPGRCFLSGLDPSLPVVALLGGDDSRAQVQSALAGEVAVVNSATVADLAILGVRPDGGPYASREFEPGEAAADHDRQLKALSSLLAEDNVQAVLAPADIDAAAEGDNPGVFISCEGADFLDGRLDGVASAYAQGARSVTLVHYRVNELGDIQTEDSFHGGLTGFGRDVVREMNRLGMIVDLAHATFDVTVGALEESSAPIMISHSHLAGPGADHPRLLSAEHASVVAEGGGLIGAWPAGVALETLDEYCVEICRLVDVVGMDHVAIGTDLDANFRPVLTSYEQFPEVAVSLGDRGMSASEVDQILGGNLDPLIDGLLEYERQDLRSSFGTID